MNRRLKSLLPVLLIAAISGSVCGNEQRSAESAPDSGPAAELPNIVVILADDLGFGDVQINNPDSRIPTPNLNRLASHGMNFLDAHSPSAVCTPTRYGLLTGRYAWRTRLKSGVLNGYGKPLIDPETVTIAEMLRDAGYRTGIVGKWHLGLGFVGDNEDFDYSQPLTDGPHTHGFDFSQVIPASLDFPPYVYIRNGNVTMVPTMTEPASGFPKFWRKGPRSADFVFEDCLDDLGREVTQFISQSAGTEPKRPFFLYFPLTAPHKPVFPHSRFAGSTELGPYGDFVHQVDDVVGQVLTAINDAAIADNTIVFFTSDNGSFMRRHDDPNAQDHVDDETIQAFQADHHRANGPWRGTKADVWEAGHRVPFFVRWPGTVRASSSSETTICHTDIFATCADIVPNGKIADDAGPDSFSFLPILKEEEQKEKRPPVINHSAAGMFALREGQWKLVFGNGSGGREAPKGKPFQKPYALFDLHADPGETTNVADEHPERIRSMEAALEQIRQEDGAE